MAFTTEFVLGAGGAGVEEIPVSVSGSGSSVDYPLATVDAGAGALIAVVGTFSGSGGTTGNSTLRPHLRIGDGVTHTYPHQAFASDTGGAVAVVVSGPVTVSILGRSSSTLTFTGTVYVARL